MRETDFLSLYSDHILELAAGLPLTEALEPEFGESFVRAPTCGSNIRVELKMEDGLVSGYHHDVKACALGQASASILAKDILGRSKEEMRQGLGILKDVLSGVEGDDPTPFVELRYFKAARDFSNRHASILLAFQAALQAIEDFEEKTHA